MVSEDNKTASWHPQQAAIWRSVAVYTDTRSIGLERERKQKTPRVEGSRERDREGVHGAEWRHCCRCQSGVPAGGEAAEETATSGALRTNGSRRGRRAEETVTPTGPGVAATFGRLAEFGVASREIPFTTCTRTTRVGYLTVCLLTVDAEVCPS